ncbi:hypothetical protein N7539_004022 [Penicillium diatomitis]|uniref:Uncharacterized protein n=1 Tax=Penicillium diatomitis TaxID=2819901 RepID=A0A9X0BYE9_9EURO|nr:uncharacterized protein N7539_004022 [Penicillium diatomitis]KAJ5489132.1 hypothetical protein N7539_004022 [Penicillium diatomitis]
MDSYQSAHASGPTGNGHPSRSEFLARIASASRQDHQPSTPRIPRMARINWRAHRAHLARETRETRVVHSSTTSLGPCSSSRTQLHQRRALLAHLSRLRRRGILCCRCSRTTRRLFRREIMSSSTRAPASTSDSESSLTSVPDSVLSSGPNSVSGTPSASISASGSDAPVSQIVSPEIAPRETSEDSMSISSGKLIVLLTHISILPSFPQLTGRIQQSNHPKLAAETAQVRDKNQRSRLPDR